MTKLEFEKSEKALVLIVALNPETGKAMYDYYDWDGTDFWLNSTRNDFPILLKEIVSGCSSRKVILHLCADLGSDSLFYQLSDEYEVIMICKEIGVENYHPPKNVHGIIANPVCTEFSTAKDFNHVGDLEKGMFLVNHCLRIIKEAQPKWWVIENPFNGRLKEILGKPKYVYQPWEYGSPWTKKTALWGEFESPKPIYKNW